MLLGRRMVASSSKRVGRKGRQWKQEECRVLGLEEERGVLLRDVGDEGDRMVDGVMA